MKNIFHCCFFLFLSILVIPSSTHAQLVSLLSDDFESYAPYQVCNGYTTDIQVYPTHGTTSSQGLRAFMNSFDSKDSLVTAWINPLNQAGTTLEFDFRIMEASALYPFIPATLQPGDQFSISYSTDGQVYTDLAAWNNANFTTVTTFTRVSLSVPSCDSARFKFRVTKVNNPTDYFVDIDNLLIFYGTSGVSENNPKPTFAALPNPFQYQLTIKNYRGENCDYELMDLQGRKLIGGKSNEQEIVISTTELPAGSYLLHLKTDDVSNVYTIIKNN